MYKSIIKGLLFFCLSACSPDVANPPSQPSVKKFLSFWFHGNPVTGTIADGAATINFTYPSGTDVSHIRVGFTFEGKTVSVNGIPQENGGNFHNFTTPVVYRITGDDGSTKDYTVSIVYNTVDLTKVETIIGPMIGKDKIGHESVFQLPRGSYLVGSTLYFAEYAQSVIKKLDLNTNQLTTIAGTIYGSGLIDGPFQANCMALIEFVAGDMQTLYFVDGYADRFFRAVNLTTLEVTTLGAVGPGQTVKSLAFYGNKLYYIDNHSQIKAFDLSSKSIELVAGQIDSTTSTDGIGTLATFTSPIGLNAAGGTLYLIENTATGKMRKVDLVTKQVTSIVTNITNPDNLLVYGAKAYIGTTGGKVLKEMALSGGTVTTLAGGGTGFQDGVGVAAGILDLGGLSCDGVNLYFTEKAIGVVRKVDLTTKAVTTISGWPRSGTWGSSPEAVGTGIRFGVETKHFTTDGTDLFVSDTTNNRIVKIKLSDRSASILAGSLTGVSGAINGTGTGATFYRPTALCSDGTNLYVGDEGNHLLRMINISTGLVTTVAGSVAQTLSKDGTGVGAGFMNFYTMAWDGQNLFIGDFSGLRKVTVPGAVVTTLGVFADYSLMWTGSQLLCGATRDLSVVNVGAGTSTELVSGVASRLYGKRPGTDGLNIYGGDINKHLIRYNLASQTWKVLTDGNSKYSDVGFEYPFVGISQSVFLGGKLYVLDGNDVWSPSIRVISTP